MHTLDIGMLPPPEAPTLPKLLVCCPQKLGVQVEFMGQTVWTTAIFGADEAELILGVTVLESVGIEVSPRTQQLKRLPAPRLK